MKKVDKIERHFNYNNPERNKNLKNRLVYIKKTQDLSETKKGYGLSL